MTRLQLFSVRAPGMVRSSVCPAWRSASNDASLGVRRGWTWTSGIGKPFPLLLFLFFLHFGTGAGAPTCCRLVHFPPGRFNSDPGPWAHLTVCPRCGTGLGQRCTCASRTRAAVLPSCSCSGGSTATRLVLQLCPMTQLLPLVSPCPMTRLLVRPAWRGATRLILDGRCSECPPLLPPRFVQRLARQCDRGYSMATLLV